MKPKNDFQRRVVAANSRGLPPLSEEVLEWAKENAVRHFAVRNERNATTCTVCHQQMIYTGDDSAKVVCLECGRELDLVSSKVWKAMRGMSKGYFSVLCVFEDLQLQRTFEIRVSHNLRKRTSQVFCREVCRHWTAPDDKTEVTALPRIMGHFLDCFPFNGNIELRGSQSRMVYDHLADCYAVYPEMELLSPLDNSETRSMILSKGPQSTIQKILLKRQLKDFDIQ